MSVKAVIDIGTNSIKLLVMDISGDRERVLSDRCVITRLGEGVANSGVISENAIERALSILHDMAAEALLLNCDKIVAVGTQALRTATNSSEFVYRVEKLYGFRTLIISGDEEARLSFCAAVSALIPDGSPKEALVLDVGGGSSEIICGGNDEISFRLSLPLGALTLHQKFFDNYRQTAIPTEVILSARDRVKSILNEHSSMLDAMKKTAMCVGVGGTITTLAAVKNSFCGTDGNMLIGKNEIERQVKLYSSMSPDNRLAIKGLQKGREDIILSGACIIAELLDFAGISSITVTERGLRYGVMKYFDAHK